MPPETKKPTAGTVGSIEGSGERPTGELYPLRTWQTEAEGVAAREREAEVIDRARKAVLDRLALLALVDDETGIQARRAAEVLQAPAIPEAVYQVVMAFGANLAAIVYRKESGDRARVAKLLNAVIVEATHVRPRAA